MRTVDELHKSKQATRAVKGINSTACRMGIVYIRYYTPQSCLLPDNGVLMYASENQLVTLTIQQTTIDTHVFRCVSAPERRLKTEICGVTFECILARGFRRVARRKQRVLGQRFDALPILRAFLTLPKHL